MNEIQEPRIGSSDDLVQVCSERSKLESLAYKLLGTVSDAEDAVQETYLRWYKLEPTVRQEIVAPIAWQRTTLTRVCFDKLKASKSKREIYVGEWLPEPLPYNQFWPSISQSANPADPADRISTAQTVSMALMIVLDKMTPAERVSFILHDVFQYSFDEISEIVDRTPQACRQLASSARKQIDRESRFRCTREEHAQVNEAFRSAWTTGNIKALVAVLSSATRAVTDGGGRVSAASEPLYGRKAVIDFFLTAFDRQSDLVIQQAIVNGEPGLIGRVGEQTVSVIATSILNGKIIDIWVMRNPEKLTVWH